MNRGATWLPKHTGELLTRAAAVARESLGQELAAVILVGSAMHPERASRALRPEVLVVVHRLPLDSLRLLAKALAPLVKKGLRPRTITMHELERGSDVFALEVAEWRTRHWLIEGEDPFGGVQIQSADLRRTIEFNLRGLGRRLRNRVLVGAAMDDRGGQARQAVLDALDTLTVAAHHTLAWLGKNAPLLDVEVIVAVGSALSIDASPVQSLLERMQKARSAEDPAAALDAILPFVDALAEAVDRLETPSGEAQ